MSDAKRELVALALLLPILVVGAYAVVTAVIR